MRKIKIRLGLLILSFILVILIMIIVINGEVKKVDNILKDYKDKLIRFYVIVNSNIDED